MEASTPVSLAAPLAPTSIIQRWVLSPEQARFFAPDEWTVNLSLTLNVWLRYDIQIPRTGKYP